VNGRAPCRRRREGGAVAVEAALVTPLLLLLIFGIIEFGMFFKDYLAVSSASRAGVRIASAEPRMATFADDAANAVLREGAALNPELIEEVWVYDADSDGYPEGGSGSFTSCSPCVKYKYDSATETMKAYSDTWPASAQNACQNDPGRDSVGIYVQYEHTSVSGLVFETTTITDHTVLSLEPIPSTQTCK